MARTVALSPAAALARWPLAGAAVVSALAGWALSQRAFQLGRLLAPVNAVISVADPAVAIALAITALGERLVHTVGSSLPLVAAGTVGVLAGVVLLSHRGARLLADL